MPWATWPEIVSGLETARATKSCAVQDGAAWSANGNQPLNNAGRNTIQRGLARIAGRMDEGRRGRASFHKGGRERDMKPNTDLPSGARPKNRFRDARRKPDFTIDQDWASYSAVEHDRWDRLFRRSLAALQSRACDEFLAMIEAL
jgi:hypothetical protein